MLVVINFSERYLWVDTYCIDQDDEKDKYTQINNMDTEIEAEKKNYH